MKDMDNMKRQNGKKKKRETGERKRENIKKRDNKTNNNKMTEGMEERKNGRKNEGSNCKPFGGPPTLSRTWTEIN